MEEDQLVQDIQQLTASEPTEDEIKRELDRINFDWFDLKWTEVVATLAQTFDQRDGRTPPGDTSVENNS